MRERLSGKRQEFILPFGEAAQLPALPSVEIRLLPAGHILGSAQIHIETDQGSLLYTGDFKLRPSLSVEPTEWCHAETLIMETTFGLPKYAFPPTEQVLAEMVAFCRSALADGAVPVLMGYSLGKAQEILCGLAQAGLEALLHSAVFKMTEIYRELRPGFPQNYELYDPEQSTDLFGNRLAGRVLVFPPNLVRSPLLKGIPNRRVAVLTGWAVEPSARFRYGADAAFPLSDHADYADLLRYVELVNPKRVLTLHGYAAAFASDLRARGMEAWALSQENQLEFRFG
jgi:Cft2 family RNA processing exonuclease